jgi:PAS domain-containing protein
MSRSSHEAILITDVRGRIVDVNEAFCQVTGYSKSELKGQNPRIMRSGRHDSAFWKNVWVIMPVQRQIRQVGGVLKQFLEHVVHGCPGFASLKQHSWTTILPVRKRHARSPIQSAKTAASMSTVNPSSSRSRAASPYVFGSS